MIKEPVNVYFVVSGKYHDIDFARLELLKLLAEHDQIRTTVAPDYT
ncbi:MAG: ThuA domain-containing protein, partial [Pseudomonadota bacterium]